MKLPSLFLALAVLSLGPLHGAIQATIEHLETTNLFSHLIASDASNPDPLYDRDAIHVETQVRFTRTVPGSVDTYNYRLVVELLDESDTPVLLDSGMGNVTSLTKDYDVLGTTATLTDNFDLVPVNLESGRLFRVRLSLQRRPLGVGAFQATGVAGTESARRWYHFTNLNGNDPEVNVIPAIQEVEWTKKWALDSDPQNDAFEISVQWQAVRYDDFGNNIAAPADITIRHQVELRRASDNQLIPLEQSLFDTVETIQSFNTIGGVRRPVTVSRFTNFEVNPVGILENASESYLVSVKVQHFPTPGAVTPVGDFEEGLPVEKLMHFNGTLRVDGATGHFTSLVAPDPVAGAVSAAGLQVSSVNFGADSGTLVGLPGFTFGGGGAVEVALEDDGDAVLTNGAITPEGPVDHFSQVSGNLKYEMTNISLTPGGKVADIVLLLPAGLGWTHDPVATRVWESTIHFEVIPLDNGLNPILGTHENKGDYWFCDDSKPIWFKVSFVTWASAISQLTLTTTGDAAFVRAAELNQLLADAEVPPGDRSKRSNDHVFQKFNQVGATVVIDADALGRAKMTGSFTSDFGLFRTHFPYDALVGLNGGTLDVAGGQIDSATSAITGISQVDVSYAQDCADASCPSGNPDAVLTFEPSGGTLHFTPDGGLVGAGQLAQPEKLQWGWIESLNRYAHETSVISASRFHLPGSCGQGTISPGEVLLSGVDATSFAVTRPGDTGFEEGEGAYAGLNFRTQGGSYTGTSTLGGNVAGPYDLSHRCQYVVRKAGVSGIHEAVTGSFPGSALVAGYPMQFEDFGIQLIHSEVTDSRTKGSLDLPEPAGISFDYDKLFFTCLGAPSTLELAPGELDSDKVLTYWQADIRVKNINFLPLADSPCEPGMSRLAIGVEAWSSEFSDTLHGTLGFHPTGQIHTLADPATDPLVTSRFKIPSNISLAGPGEERWAATTVGDAYLNHAADAPGEVGWMNIAAKIDLPFFEDGAVHLHTRCRKDDPGALLYLMGGFHAPGKGFQIGGADFFTAQPFDNGHRGFANGVTLAQYREGISESDDRFQLHAQKKWLDLVDLDYAMKWEVATRSFKSFRDTEGTKLLVLEIDHRCRRLTPDNADLDFGARAGLPKLSLTELASGQVSELFDALGDDFNDAIFNNGRAAIEQLLEPTARDLLGSPVDLRLAQASEDLVSLLLDQHWESQSKQFDVTVNTALLLNLLNASDLGGAYQEIAGATADVQGVLQEVKSRLELAKSHIEDFREFSKPGPGNKFESIAATAMRLAGKVSSKLDDPEYEADVENLIAEIRPILLELDSLAEKAEIVCQDLLDSLEGNGPLATELKSLFADANQELNDAVAMVASDVQSLIAPYLGGVDQLTDPEVRELLRGKIQQAMSDRFFSTGLTAGIHQVLKQRAYDLEQQMRQVVDGVFEQADEVSRQLIESVLGGLDKKLTKFLGEVSEVMAGAELKGKAHIRGDSLTDLRLDLKVELNVSDKMKAHVFLEIKELNSDNTPGGCLPPGGTATEVTMGAKEVSIEWIYPGLSANFDTRFQFGDGGLLTGMGGSFEVLGEINFSDQFTIHEMGAAVLFGKEEFYLSAEVALSVSKGFKGKGGIFFGRSCTLAPFFWDPTIEAALGEAPFTGAYAYGEAHVALNQILGIPPSCLLNLTAGMGQGVGLFAEGPTGVGKIFYALEGEVLCIATVSGEVSLTGVLSLEDFSPTLVGQGVLRGEVGYCPLCLDFEKTLTLIFKNWKLSHEFE